MASSLLDKPECLRLSPPEQALCLLSGRLVWEQVTEDMGLTIHCQGEVSQMPSSPTVHSFPGHVPHAVSLC